jgi:outer membrane protein assembly factor BamB
MTSSPIVRNGLAVTGSEAGVLYAVRAQGDAAGALAWRYPETGSLGAPIRGRVAADATGLYFTANDGILHKIDANGQPLWQSRVVPAGTDTEAMPIVTDDAVTLACGDGRVRRIDKQTGSILAASPTVGLGTLSTPSMPRDGDLWLGGSDGRLYNMDVDHGFTVMSAHSISNQPMSATPFVDARSGVVMSVSGEGDVFAMRVRSDQIVWGPKSLGSPVKGSPWVDSNAGIAYFATTSGTLHALRVTDGAPVAGYPVQLTTTGGFVGAPVVLPLPNGQTTVFLGSTSGTFFAVNAANPGRVARFETGDPTVQFAGAPALSGPTMDDIIVVAGTNGRLYGFRVRDAVAAM